MHVDLRMTSFPFIRQHLDGTTYYKRPSNYEVVFDKVPPLAKGFDKMFADVGDPSSWEKRFVVTYEGERDYNGRKDIELRLVQRVRGMIDHETVLVDPATWSIDSIRYDYYNGGHITMTQTFREVGGYLDARRAERRDRDPLREGRRTRHLLGLQDQRRRRRLGLHEEEVMLTTGQRSHAGVEETRGKILAAARELFERNGTRGTTTREVAERAGVNEATLFRHFGSKRALLDAMREQACGVEQFRVDPGRAARRRLRRRLARDRLLIVDHMMAQARDDVRVAGRGRGRHRRRAGMARPLADPHRPGSVFRGQVAGRARRAASRPSWPAISWASCSRTS